jgi:hypothetical protein
LQRLGKRQATHSAQDNAGEQDWQAVKARHGCTRLVKISIVADFRKNNSTFAAVISAA